MASVSAIDVAAVPAYEARRGQSYQPELDTLRFFAFFAVFLHHALPHTPDAYLRVGLPAIVAGAIASLMTAGGFGVDLFFALSSYLITTQLLREVDGYGNIDALAFYMRRALRIWPLYFAFLGLVLVLRNHLPNEHIEPRHTVAFLLFVGNWSTAFWGYPSTVASPLWSVSIEEQFYLAWPWVLRWTGVRRLAGLAVGLLVLATATRVVLVVAGAHHPAIWTDTFARMDPIALGGLLALWCWKRPEWSTGPLVRIVLVVAALAILAAAGHWNTLDGRGSLVLYPAVAVAVTALLVAFLRPTGGAWFFSSPVLTYLGRISYGLYVFHVLGLTLAGMISRSSNGARAVLIQLVLGIAITIAMAMLSYHSLESYFLRKKKRFTRVRMRD